MEIQTKHCIQCGRIAKSWAGYVVKNGKKIIAGWCGYHYETGYCGTWKKRDRIERYKA